LRVHRGFSPGENIRVAIDINVDFSRWCARRAVALNGFNGFSDETAEQGTEKLRSSVEREQHAA
jgi:hypothetical protein